MTHLCLLKIGKEDEIIQGETYREKGQRILGILREQERRKEFRKEKREERKGPRRRKRTLSWKPEANT